MQLSQFFEYLKRTKTLPEGKVFCFSAPTYPLLFFHHLITFLRRNGTAIETLSCENNDTATIKALLSTMSFSGNITYWLEGFAALAEKKQQELIHYFRTYEGPHRVLFFSDIVSDLVEKTSANDALTSVTLPRTVMLQDFLSIRFLVNEQLHTKSAFASQLTMYSDYLSLDIVCLLAQYELVLGKNADDFFANWITRIIDPTSSLFVLSQHFFGKKLKPFFRQWATISDEYPPTFWALFWADQVWRAYVYCDLMEQKKYAEAKKAQYKLPFSFIQRDWSQYKLLELVNAHQFLTTMDFKLKNGSSEIGLEHFYNQFFENEFR